MAETVQVRALELRLLGPLEARRAGETIALGGVKPRALLANLAVHLGEAVPADRLVDDLWGERPPVTAAHALEVYVSKLRKAIDPERAGRIAARSGGYALELDPEWVDARRFERLVADARATPDPGARAALLAEGLALWRGPPLADLTYEPFAQHEIARLEELRSGAIEDRIEAELVLGRAAELVPELESLIAANPFREGLRRQLMLALYRSGRQADALAAYRATRETLRDELGVDPGPELRALEAAILRQDEELLAAASAPVAAAPARRRTLATILFADVDDSTGLVGSHDPETVRAAFDRYFELAAAVLAEHGGTVEKFVGDAVMAVFGIPAASEDDALRALRAAVELRDGLRELGESLERDLGLGLEVQLGVASGEVVSGDSAAGEVFATGEAVNVAARLQQAAGPGEIVVGAATARLVGPAARLEGVLVRGRAEAAFRLLELVPEAPALERRLDAPLVGRTLELGRLREAFERAVAEGSTRAVTLLGAAGIGKSRLAAEVARSLGDRALVLKGRCPSYGRGITFLPLRAILRDAAGDDSREAILALLDGSPDAEAVADRLAAGASPPAEELFWAFRLLCDSLAARRPLLLVLDDLHWAEPTLLDLVEHLVDRSGTRMLVLCLAREELLEERPDFLGGRATCDMLLLDALSAEETEALVAELAAALPNETRQRIAEAAEGNPLFLEQLVALAAEGGFDTERPLPATIQALLLARLDRLGPGERAVLERAAVVGREFSRAAVTDLLEPAAAATARRHLETLVRRGFVRPAAATAAFEDAYRFRHVLIQSAVYGATPKSDRVRLHERHAGLLEDAGADDALVGYHLEQAYRYCAELGPVDRHARGLAADAGAKLGGAGIRAWKTGDARATTNLLGRATALLPSDAADRRELLCEFGLASHVVGEALQADEILAEAVELASSAADRRTELRARMELEHLQLLREPQGSGASLLALTTEAIPFLEAVHDDRSLGRAWIFAGFVQGGIRCRHAEWVDCAESAIRHYSRAGWPPAACVGDLAAALYYGPTPVPEAAARCESLLIDSSIGRGGQANVLAFLGGLEAQRGRFDDARRLVGLAAEIHDELGQHSAAATYSRVIAGDVELGAGCLDAAERIWRELCVLLTGHQNWSALSTRAADLAEVLYLQGLYGDADEWTRISQKHAAREDLSAQLSWRSVRAKLAARAGHTGEAEALAREAVAVARNTDGVNWQAKTCLDLAEVLRLSDRGDECGSLIEEARLLYERKGNVISARRAATLLTPV
jgi:DNA-binding SARP family transcriptional activator